MLRANMSWITALLVDFDSRPQPPEAPSHEETVTPHSGDPERPGAGNGIDDCRVQWGGRSGGCGEVR